MKWALEEEVNEYFPCLVSSISDDVHPNHHLAALVSVWRKIRRIMSSPEILEGIKTAMGVTSCLLRNCLSELAKGVNTFVLLLLVMIGKENIEE
nr:hypothetical protein [Tanacetum cinerariifolium]